MDRDVSNKSLPFHDESTALAHAPAARVFAYLDDPKTLAAHMGESSMMSTTVYLQLVLRRAERSAGRSTCPQPPCSIGLPGTVRLIIIHRRYQQ